MRLLILTAINTKTGKMKNAGQIPEFSIRCNSPVMKMEEKMAPIKHPTMEGLACCAM
jgi:hypothetical protein